MQKECDYITMSNIMDKLKFVEEKADHYWAKRITSQLEYAVQLNKVLEHKYDQNLTDSLDFLSNEIAREGTITETAAKAAEKKLDPLSKDAKEYRMLCVAHAHMDMNWMWRSLRPHHIFQL